MLGFGSGGDTNFFGTEGSFKDFNTMQSDFAGLIWLRCI